MAEGARRPKTVKAKGARIPGKGKLKAIEDAPGRYVKRALAALSNSRYFQCRLLPSLSHSIAVAMRFDAGRVLLRLADPLDIFALGARRESVERLPWPWARASSALAKSG